MNPALQYARNKTQSVKERDFSGRVTIAGKTYDAAVVIGAMEPEMRADGAGTILVQRGTVSIRKSLLQSAPTRGTVVTYDGKDYSMVGVSGESLPSTAWSIQIQRLPD